MRILTVCLIILALNRAVACSEGFLEMKKWTCVCQKENEIECDWLTEAVNPWTETDLTASYFSLSHPNSHISSSTKLVYSFFSSKMDEDATVKEAEEYNAAGNCAFKDKEYEKAIRFYTYVAVYYLI